MRNRFWAAVIVVAAFSAQAQTTLPIVYPGFDSLIQQWRGSDSTVALDSLLTRWRADTSFRIDTSGWNTGDTSRTVSDFLERLRDTLATRDTLSRLDSAMLVSLGRIIDSLALPVVPRSIRASSTAITPTAVVRSFDLSGRCVGVLPDRSRSRMVARLAVVDGRRGRILLTP